MDFDDWIRIQLRSGSTAAPAGAPPLRSTPAFASPVRARGLVIQCLVAGMALVFFAFGLMAGVPAPSLHLNFLPTQSPEIAITSLALAAPPAPPTAAPVAVLSGVPAGTPAVRPVTPITAITRAVKAATKSEGGSQDGGLAGTAAASRSSGRPVPPSERLAGGDGHGGDHSGSDHPEATQGSGKEGN